MGAATAGLGFLGFLAFLGFVSPTGCSSSGGRLASRDAVARASRKAQSIPPRGTRQRHLCCAPSVGIGYRQAMSSPFTFYPDLAAEAPIPARGIHSQTLSSEDGIELVLFAFAAGEQLSEHTSSRPAVIHVLSGEGDLSVAGVPRAVRAGTWVRMSAGTPHSLVAHGPMVMALYLLPSGTPDERSG